MKKISLVVLLAALISGLSSEVQAQIPGIRSSNNNVLLTFHVVEANGYAEVDPEIADIVDELRNVLRFDGYRLLDTSVLRADLSPEMPASDRPPTAVVGQRLGAFAIQAYVSRAA